MINEATVKLQELNLEGNVIPHKWFNEIKMKNGSPDYQAIILLSEIVYWYRPTAVYNEQGIYKGIKKKYKEDLLQKSYEDLSSKFGMTKRQAKEAIVRLEDRGLIKREFRNLIIKGSAVNNVLYIHLFVDELKSITICENLDNTSVTKSDKSYDDTASVDYPPFRQTNTDITTNNTTKKKDSMSENKFSDVEEVIKFYKELENLPTFIKMTDKRKSHINARITDYGLERVKQGLTIASNSVLLKQALEKGEKWYSVDFIFNTNKFAFLLEGKYDYLNNNGQSIKNGYSKQVDNKWGL